MRLTWSSPEPSPPLCWGNAPAMKALAVPISRSESLAQTSKREKSSDARGTRWEYSSPSCRPSCRASSAPPGVSASTSSASIGLVHVRSQASDESVRLAADVDCQASSLFRKGCISCSSSSSLSSQIGRDRSTALAVDRSVSHHDRRSVDLASRWRLRRRLWDRREVRRDAREMGEHVKAGVAIDRDGERELSGGQGGDGAGAGQQRCQAHG